MPEYIVLAGKNTKAGEACNYEKSFSTLEEALAAQEGIFDYPWHRIVVREGDFEYEIAPRRIRRKVDDGKFVPCTTRGTLTTEI